MKRKLKSFQQLMEDYPTSNFVEGGGLVSYSNEVGTYLLSERITNLLGKEIETDNFPSLPKNFFLFEDTDLYFEDKADIAVQVMEFCVQNDMDIEQIENVRESNKTPEEKEFLITMLDERICDNIGYIQELIKKYKEI
jgi:hypothetical protein